MRRPRFVHPSKRRLQAWLDQGDRALDDHISACAQCASRLEDFSEPDASLGDALRAVLAPPGDLQPRLLTGIAAKMQTRDDLRLLVELIGLPVSTMRALGPPPSAMDEVGPSDRERP